MSNWYEFPRWMDKFERGLDEYLEDAFTTRSQGDQISCPCTKCCFRYWFRDKNVLKDHVIANGFIPRLDKPSESCSNNDEVVFENIENSYNNDGVDELLNDTFKRDPNEETKMFYKLVEEGQQELYPGCKNFSKLSFTLQLFLFKCDHKLSNAAFGDLLKLLKVMQPEAKLPASFSEAKNILKALGLDYNKIDACPNNCMLYWDEHVEATHCHVCKTPRWKPDEKDEATKQPRRVPLKILRYFPIKKRLQRLFMSAKTAHYMTWHANGRPKDNHLRHPADGKSWKEFDLANLEFSKET